MTKAQEVRKNRLEQLKSFTAQAQETFDWILELMDSDNKNGKFERDVTIKFVDDYKLERRVLNPECVYYYELKGDFCGHTRKVMFFTALKKIIEQEEGFCVEIGEIHSPNNRYKIDYCKISIRWDF